MFLLIYVLDSVSFVMLVYLCIHYYQIYGETVIQRWVHGGFQQPNGSVV